MTHDRYLIEHNADNILKKYFMNLWNFQKHIYLICVCTVHLFMCNLTLFEENITHSKSYRYHVTKESDDNFIHMWKFLNKGYHHFLVTQLHYAYYCYNKFYKSGFRDE